jgi:cell division protein ZipA
MTALHWILFAAGALLLIGIYFWGRHSNKRNVAEQPPARLQPRPETVPQLHEVVGSAPRASSDNILIHDEPFDVGDLPSMSAHGSAPLAEPAPRDSWGSTPTFSSVEAAPAVQAAAMKRTPAAEQRVAPQATESSRASKRPAAQRKIVALRLAAGEGAVDGAKLKSLLEAAALVHGKYGIYHRMHDTETPLFSVASMVEPGTFDPFAMSGVQFPGVTIFMQLPGPLDGMDMLASMLACARQLEQGMGGSLQDERGLPLIESREQRLRDDVENFLHLLGT